MPMKENDITEVHRILLKAKQTDRHGGFSVHTRRCFLEEIFACMNRQDGPTSLIAARITETSRHTAAKTYTKALEKPVANRSK